MKRKLGDTIAFVALAACSHHRPLTNGSELVGDEVEIVTHDHQQLVGTAVQTREGLVFRTASGDVPLEAVAQVDQNRMGRGAAEGAGLGFLLGAGAGIAIGFADGDDPPCTPPGSHVCDGQYHLILSAGDKAIVGGILLGVLGAGVGLLIGAARGSHFIYKDRAALSIRPIGPPGTVAGLTLSF